jgi:hypothetical protein
MSSAISPLRVAVKTGAAVQFRLRSFDNYQVQYFASAWTVPHGHIGAEHLGLACRRLEQFQMTRHVNVGQNRFSEAMPIKAKTFFELNRYDMELYQFAAARR